jgi:hypothetical protein
VSRRATLAVPVVLAACALAVAAATSCSGTPAGQAGPGPLGGITQASEETRAAEAAFRSVYHQGLGVITARSGDGYVFWTAELASTVHSSTADYRLLSRMFSYYRSKQAVLRLGTIQPASDGTGRNYVYYWNPGVLARASGVGTIPPDTAVLVLMRSSRPAIEESELGSQVATLPLTPAQARAYGSGGNAPVFPPTTKKTTR